MDKKYKSPEEKIADMAEIAAELGFNILLVGTEVVDGIVFGNPAFIQRMAEIIKEEQLKDMQNNNEFH